MSPFAARLTIRRWMQALLAMSLALALVVPMLRPAAAAPPWKLDEDATEQDGGTTKKTGKSTDTTGPGNGKGNKGGGKPADDEPPPADDEPPPTDDDPPPTDDDPPPTDDDPPPTDDDPAAIAPIYTAWSPWNTPIPTDAPVHPDSDVFIESFEAAASTGARRPLTSDPTQYTYPVHRVSSDTPGRLIQLSGNYSDVVDETTTRTSSAPALRVPIPLDAQPSPGTDASIIIWNEATGDEWGFWQFQNHGDGTFSARNGYHYNTRWSGVPPTAPNRFGSRGAGVPYFAGLVRRDEIDTGRIDHALAFAYDYPTPEVVWPATKSDGTGIIGRDVPEGTRIRLDPRLTEADFDAWGLSSQGRIIARALQRYGMYTIDQAGRPKIMIEDDQTADWQGSITAATVSAIPWDAFEVVDWRAAKPPVPVLGADRTIPSGSFVTLDGSSSYDPDGTAVDAYAWTAPAGATLTDTDTATPKWDTAGLAPGTYAFSLRVRDASGVWSVGSATITYTIAEPQVPTVLQQEPFGGTYTEVVSGPAWRPLSGEELVTIVTLRPARTTVETVTGNGVQWTRVLRHRDTQGELAVEVWRASGSAPAAGAVTVTTSTQAWAANAHALRMSRSRVVAAAATDTGATDTRFPSVQVTTPDAPAFGLGIHVGRATPFTPDPGLDEIARHEVGDGGNNVRTTLLSTTTAAPGTQAFGGTQSSPLDWVMAGLVFQDR